MQPCINFSVRVLHVFQFGKIFGDVTRPVAKAAGYEASDASLC